MSRRKNWMVFLLALCIFVTVISTLSFLLPASAAKPQSGQSVQPLYLLRDNAGYLALYDPADGHMIQQYEIYTRFLPETDIDALRAGIAVYSEEELARLIEDFGG